MFAVSWQQLVRDRIFQPLGMNNTFTSIDAALLTGNYAIPYALIQEPGPPRFTPFPADMNRVVFEHEMKLIIYPLILYV